MKRKAKIFYTSLDDFWRKEEKLNWLRDNPIEKIQFDSITPDEKHNWINQTDNDFEILLPLIDKGVKLGRIEEAVFELFSLGVVTARDEWVYDFDKNKLSDKINFLIDSYNKDLKVFKGKSKDKIKEEIGKRDTREIKWTRAVVNDLTKNKKFKFDESKIREFEYRPFIKKNLYFDSDLNEMQYQLPQVYGERDNVTINFLSVNSSNELAVLASNKPFDYCYLKMGNGGTQCLPRYKYSENQKHENITDWGLTQFQTHYKASNGAKITKQDIFYYTYAVLHAPVYRKKYEQNLKREFPRLPFYDDFTKWRDWGERLMDLHVNYETQEPFALERKDLDLTVKRKIANNTMFDEIANKRIDEFVSKPQTKLRADKENGAILIDSMTTLSGIPPTAWEYKLGNRSALEWILDQYKEKKPQDATIAERFNTYKFEDYKEQVIDLLKRVTNVSVRTMEIVNRMPKAD
ncbi:MAG TPA: type ISP restriction/modification enzyme [Pyrinomonadaceae bacterium]|nr:type ISP restriction/modification enzyme [Pyrinomonadaceae bacterium]